MAATASGSMGIRATGLVTAVAIALAACGGSGGRPAGATEPTGATSEAAAGATGEAATPEGSASPAATATSSAAAAPRKTKIDQCQDVGQAMQRAQPPDTMANVTDATKLRAVAKELRGGADEVERAATDIDELRQVRDAYVVATRGMAAALEDAAGAKDSAQQKAAIAKFRADEPKQDELLMKLNDVCNAKTKK